MESILVFTNLGSYSEGAEFGDFGIHPSTSDDVSRDRVVLSTQYRPKFVSAGDQYEGEAYRRVIIYVEQSSHDEYDKWDELQTDINNYFRATMAGIEVSFVKNRGRRNNDDILKFEWLDRDDPDASWLHGDYNINTRIIRAERPLIDVSFHHIIIHEILHSQGLYSHRTLPECSLNIMHEHISNDNFYLSPLQIITLHGIIFTNMPDNDSLPISRLL